VSTGTIPGIEPFFCASYPDPEDRGPGPWQGERRTTTYCKDQATKAKTLKARTGKGTPLEAHSIRKEKDALSKTGSIGILKNPSDRRWALGYWGSRKIPNTTG